MQLYKANADSKRAAPLFSLMFRRYPSAMFRSWVGEIEQHIQKMKLQLGQCPAQMENRFQELEAQFTVAREAAYHCCDEIDEASDKERKLAMRHMSRLMWVMSELHDECSRMMGCKQVFN